MGGNVELAISQSASRYGINRKALERVVWNESRGNIKAGMNGSNYSAGVAQISRSVWRSYSNLPYADASKPMYYQQNIDVAAQYLKALHKRFGNWTIAIAAYNEGPTLMRRILSGQRGLSPITQKYIAGFAV